MDCCLDKNIIKNKSEYICKIVVLYMIMNMYILIMMIMIQFKKI